jgi:hypothetical protein
VDEVHEVHGTVVLQHGALRAARAAGREDDVAHVAGCGSQARRCRWLLCKRIALLVNLRACQIVLP